MKLIYILTETVKDIFQNIHRTVGKWESGWLPNYIMKLLFMCFRYDNNISQVKKDPLFRDIS